ncbi:double-stranded RNA-specific editase 1-like isoform X2 [Lycorma delicatula]|uniref:double-stranded RNA-specific editase 1-like isoform X2 n=1 Tax=Lycorma delicatula TaxID=130591 RepID=UPI003F50D8DA
MTHAREHTQTPPPGAVQEHPRARLGPQVNYHQTQNTPQRSGNRSLNLQNPGYSTTTTTTSSSYNQSSFSSQTGYSSVQSGKTFAPLQQSQQSQQQPKQQPQPPPLLPANAGTAASITTEATPPPQQQQQQPNQSIPSLDVPSTGESVMPQSNDASVPMNEDKPENNNENRKKPFWKKGPGFKVSRRIKRLKQNAELRKMLIPKDAFVILSELHPGVKFTVKAQLNAINQAVYLITVYVDGKTFHGQALSKAAAKKIACENALKSLLLEKMDRAVHEASEQMEHSQTESVTEDVKSESGNIDDTMDGSSVSSNRPKRRIPEDDIPWGSIASFALHKLFLEWQNQGIEVPVLPIPARSSTLSRPVSRSSTVVSQPSAESFVQASGPPMPMKKIPEDAHKRNPVQLLNQLRPGCPYSEQSSGIAPHVTFSMSVVIDGEEFVGIAGNKKDAKRECAKAALIKMGVIYGD